MDRRHGLLVFLVVFAGTAFATGGVKQSQEFTLVPGWNAKYVAVAPDESADEIFGSWPVTSVAVYDPASFLSTQQYTGEGSTEGVADAGYRMWRRGQPALSTVERIVANSVCVCFSTNAVGQNFKVRLFGRPCAPRNTWHPSSTNDAMNLIGVSVAPDTVTKTGNYFEGLDAGRVSYSSIRGLDPANVTTVPLRVTESLAPGQVVVATATKVSDWSGVMNVSPISGLDFATDQQRLSFTVRNDGAVARTVRIALGPGAAATVSDLPPIPPGLLVRDLSSNTSEWKVFSSSFPIERCFEVGESVTWQMAVDRTKVTGAAGTYYGGLLTFDDVDGGSGMRVTLPVELTSDGGVSDQTAWPKGLWLAQAELDTVTFFESGAAREVKAGGKAKVRLPLYVASAHDMKLLQRFTFGNDSNGTLRVYSGKHDFPTPVELASPQRVSSAVLPVDQPMIDLAVTVTASHLEYHTNVVDNVTNVTEVVVVDSAITNGLFGTAARFDFTVDETSKVNPFRHVYHPGHDGLKWDFATETPSGDNITNYVSSVKPEVFSVGNSILFTFDGTNGTAWSPEEELSGTLIWELSGVRHEGAIRMSGKFSMRRIASVVLDR